MTGVGGSRDVCERACPKGHVFKDMAKGACRFGQVVVLLCAAPGSALAYSSPSLYAADPGRAGGGGGRAFTGAPADGFDCGVCHGDAAAPERALRGGPGGPYTPGATYMFDLQWPAGEHLGLAMEAADLDGAPLGALRLAPRDLLAEQERCGGGGHAAQLLALDGRAPVALGDCGATRLRVQWTAPAEPIAGDLYVAMVVADGDGTPGSDAVAAVRVPLVPVGAEVGGCSVAPTRGSWGLLVVLVGLWRRFGRGVFVLGMLVVMVGCARVQPHERGRLARPDMQLAPDPDLTAGVEHALEYREGSAGGLGGGGGGCGCN